MGSSLSSTSQPDRTISLHIETIDAPPNEFKLHIHHRSIAPYKNLSKMWGSAGHFFLSLQGHPEGNVEGKSQITYIGKYGRKLLNGPEVIGSK